MTRASELVKIVSESLSKGTYSKRPAENIMPSFRAAAEAEETLAGVYVRRGFKSAAMSSYFAASLHYAFVGELAKFDRTAVKAAKFYWSAKPNTMSKEEADQLTGRKTIILVLSELIDSLKQKQVQRSLRGIRRGFYHEAGLIEEALAQYYGAHRRVDDTSRT